ncbi:MAG: DEAD/DEAH box helicase [Chloroflexi bacterium]|nr:MAG: DEAD/DEAH box helicase [Chloroflexota bacterium]
MTDELIAAYEATLPFTLDEFQREAIAKLEQSRGVLVSAPTSSGKTVVAEYAIWRRLSAPHALRRPQGTPQDVIYTTPLKALSNQKFRDLGERYGTERIGLVTGEHTINDSAPVVVMTTEILRNVLYDEPGRVDRVGDVVLDEVHYIDDFPRGTVWEEVIIEAPHHIRVIGLSATISNVDEVAAWMTGLRGPIATVTRTERPVALEMWLAVDNSLHPLFDPKGNADRRTLELAQTDVLRDPRWRYARRAPDNDLLRIIEELARRRMLPAIYFIFSRRGCREALARCDLHNLDLTTADEKHQTDRFLQQRLTALTDDDERRVVTDALPARLLHRGVAMHHAGMLPYAKETVEHLFQRGAIKVVFATETLSLGLNMPARSCVISSFTKFDGTAFAPLTSSELTQLMGRAGRRGIDTLGHGVILKESDVDVRDIYDAALSGEFAVASKFAPTYGMVLSLLRTRTAAEAEALLDKSFGQFQSARQLEHWAHRRANLEKQLVDLKRRRFRHPRVPCTERTLTQFLHASSELTDVHNALRRQRREHWRSGRGRSGRGGTDPGQRYEALKRRANTLQRRVNDSPCPRCPYLAEHRAHRRQVEDTARTLEGGEAELEHAQHRFTREFRALRAVLREAGFLDGDAPTALGLLAEGLYGESALIVANAIAAGTLEGLRPEELAGTLVMLVAEDRGRERPPASRRRFPTARVEQCHRELRSALRRLEAVEAEHGLHTLAPLSLDYVSPAYRWGLGEDLTDIEPPAGADVGDVVKAVKSLYSLLRQMEQALRGHALHQVVQTTRERIERDLIRRV